MHSAHDFKAAVKWLASPLFESHNGRAVEHYSSFLGLLGGNRAPNATPITCEHLSHTADLQVLHVFSRLKMLTFKVAVLFI
jgi:hypothetical protein